MTVTRGTVTIDVERCKGCELCIAACRPGVLVMSTETNHNGYRYPLLEPGCTACRACRDVCPDYCFEVFRFERPIESVDSLESVEGVEGVDSLEGVDSEVAP